MRKPRIVFDTNILISIFVFPGGTLQEIFERIIRKDYILGISQEIIREFENVLKKKFSLSADKITATTEFLRRNSMLVKPQSRLNIIKDESDNRILECAAAFHADYIISGDKHVLDLKKYKNIIILKAGHFLKHKG